MKIKTNLLIALIGLGLTLAAAGASLGQSAPTWIKAALEPERGNPATQVYGTSLFADFVHFATPMDYVRTALAVILVALGITWFVVAYRTKWFPDR